MPKKSTTKKGTARKPFSLKKTEAPVTTVTLSQSDIKLLTKVNKSLVASRSLFRVSSYGDVPNEIKRAEDYLVYLDENKKIIQTELDRMKKHIGGTTK